jgi:hypothetical protein
MRKAYKHLDEKPQRKRAFGDVGVDGVPILDPIEIGCEVRN